MAADLNFSSNAKHGNNNNNANSSDYCEANQTGYGSNHLVQKTAANGLNMSQTRTTTHTSNQHNSGAAMNVGQPN